MNQPVQNQQNGFNLELVKVCPLCAGRRIEPKFDVRQITDDPVHSYASELGLLVTSIVECTECEFMFKEIRPSVAYLRQLYTQSSDVYLESIAEEQTELREDFRVALRLLQEAFPRGGSILDLGCASGFFLESLGQSWNRHGVEFFHLAAERARNRIGLTVHECDLISAGLASDTFDVVTSFDVLEHLPDPMPILHEARRILKPGGWLLLGTGNFGSFSARMAGNRWTYLCIPEHVSFFNPCSLKVALTKAGFSSFKFKRVHHGLRSPSVTTGWLRAVGKHLAVRLFGDDILHMEIFRTKTSEFLVPYFFDHMICVAQ